MKQTEGVEMKRKVNDRTTKCRQILSVFGLLARSSFLKVLGILVLMVIGELLLFRYDLFRCYDAVTGGVKAPEKLVEYALLPMLFLAALALIMVALIWTEVRMSEKAGYTMMRLGLSRKELFAIKTIYNVVCLVLLFVVQIWLAVGMLAWYGEFVPLELPMPQLLFIAFYRNGFLHCLLPMQEIGKWIRNLLMIVALSMTAAGVIAFPGEKGIRQSASCWSVVILAVAWFLSSPGKNLLDMCSDILFLGVIVWELLKVFGVFGRTEATAGEADA